MLSVLAAAALLGAGAYGATDADARPATKAETKVIQDLLVKRFPQDPPKCRATWDVRVAQSKPRMAVAWPKYAQRERFNCLVGNGVIHFSRPNVRSQKWRHAGDGPAYVECGRGITMSIARQLGFREGCVRGAG